VIYVRDSGAGIAASELSRIFEMFQQVDTSLERTESGLGIGLTLVKHLVELHGGTVSVHSGGLGKGSTFVVRLPGVIVSRDGAPSRTADGPHFDGHAHRILVVDDNRDSADSLATILRMSGHEVSTAYDGMEAVEVAERILPRVVLLDLGLPKLNGFETARRIRERHPDRKVTIFAVSGWNQPEDRRRSSEAGFDGHLVKPVDFAKLEEMLKKLSP
jgi:CheY-like chemotaxis protein